MVLVDEDEKHQRQEVSNIIKISQSCKPSPDSQMLLTEIIFEILVRLPVGALLRCRCVCKQWCSLISDPHFVKSHLSLSTGNQHYTHHRLIYTTDTEIIKLCHLYDMFPYDSINALEVDYPFKEHRKSASVVGSCNGLVCMSIGYDTLYIWNPSTRKSNRLPYNGPKTWRTRFGFGYEKSTNDYKVVKISNTMTIDATNIETLVSIHSLKNGHWKETGAFSNGFLPLKYSCVFLNGALHWLATKGYGSSYPGIIISMDLAKETYGEVLQPLYYEGDKVLTLGALREWLCVACNHGIRVDLWVMKVYGMKESWTKFVSITSPDDHLERFHHLLPLWIINDGKILLQILMNLYVYDFKSKSFLEIDDCVGACTYVESLVSPHSPSMSGRPGNLCFHFP